MRDILRFLFLLLAVCVAGFAHHSAHAQGAVTPPYAESAYRLGPQDKISVKVFEWRPSVDQIYAWEALNEKYVVGSSGQLSLPLIGEIPVAGLTTQELAQQISERLRDRMRLAAAPDASVEVIEYRPFYLLGQVEKPGPYPYQPGMTVLRAVSIGGGVSRATDTGMMRLQREAISARGELEVLMTEYDSLVARSARLEAELASAEAITFPAEMMEEQDQPATRRLMEQETLIFQARQQGFATQLGALRQLGTFLEEEVKSLKSQRLVHNTQEKLVNAELEKVRTLSAKGLTTGTRQLELERLSAQLEGDGLRLDGSLIRARQDISRNEIAILELENKRKSDVTSELQDAKKQLDQIQSKRNTSAKLVYEAEVIAPGLLLQQDPGDRSKLLYKIVRSVDGQETEINAEESTPVFAGDTIKVEIPPLKRRGANSVTGAASSADPRGVAAARNDGGPTGRKTE